MSWFWHLKSLAFGRTPQYFEAIFASRMRMIQRTIDERMRSKEIIVVTITWSPDLLLRLSGL